MTATSAANSPSRGRIIAARILLVLGVLLLVLSILSTYVKREALDSGQFRQTSQQLIADPAIQEAVAAQMTDALANVDFTSSLEAKLPTNLQALASPIAGLAQGFVGTAAREPPRPAAHPGRVRRPRRALADSSSSRSCTATRRRWTRRTATSSSTSGRSSSSWATGSGSSRNLADQIPPDAGQVTILEADNLDTAQKLTHWLEQIANFVWIFALAALVARHLAGPWAPAAGGSLARHRSRRRRRDRARRALARRQVRRRSTRRQRFDAAGGPQRVADHHAVARRRGLGRARRRHPRRDRGVARRPRQPRHCRARARSPRTCGGPRSRGARSSSGCCCSSGSSRSRSSARRRCSSSRLRSASSSSCASSRRSRLLLRRRPSPKPPAPPPADGPS